MQSFLELDASVSALSAGCNTVYAQLEGTQARSVHVLCVAVCGGPSFQVCTCSQKKKPTLCPHRTSNFLARIDELLSQRCDVETRQAQVAAFLTQYQLTDAEMEVGAGQLEHPPRLAYSVCPVSMLMRVSRCGPRPGIVLTSP